MLDLLKKIGVPATVAAVIASLITIVPFLFKLDERYAKEEDLKQSMARLEAQIIDLRKELAQNAGFQQAMVAFIQQGRLPSPTPAPAPVAVPPPAPTGAGAGAPPPAVPFIPPPAVSVAPPPRLTARPAPRPPAPEPEFNPNTVPPSSAGTPASAAPKPAIVPEKPQNWKELSEGLMRQQQRLIKAD